MRSDLCPIKIQTYLRHLPQKNVPKIEARRTKWSCWPMRESWPPGWLSDSFCHLEWDLIHGIFWNLTFFMGFPGISWIFFFWGYIQHEWGRIMLYSRWTLHFCMSLFQRSVRSVRFFRNNHQKFAGFGCRKNGKKMAQPTIFSAGLLLGLTVVVHWDPSIRRSLWSGKNSWSVGTFSMG